MKQTIDPHHFDQEARQIRAQVSTVLKKWGLLPRFKRWRLTQDPDTGMIVLFGILNNRYIATHTSTPFSNYFDPRLLHDLEDEVQVQVVSCNSDGLRYAFILDRGQFGRLPTHIDFPFVDNGKLMARVAFSDKPRQSESVSPVAIELVDDERLVREGVVAFLKVFDDIKLRDDAAQISAKNPPDIVIIDEDEFNRRVAEDKEANRQLSRRIRKLFEEKSE